MNFKCSIVVFVALALSGCSAKMWKVAGVSAASGLAGAGVGYAFIHHGREKEYRLTNTVISASIFAALGAGVAYWHLMSLEKQKIELAGKFSRSHYLETGIAKNLDQDLVQIAISSKKSLSLDQQTRWVFPEFRKRMRPPERGESEIISSHYSWEIARPGFFVTREQYPSLFKEETLPND